MLIDCIMARDELQLVFSEPSHFANPASGRIDCGHARAEGEQAGREHPRQLPGVGLDPVPEGAAERATGGGRLYRRFLAADGLRLLAC